jgi:hypothetical protein
LDACRNGTLMARNLNVRVAWPARVTRSAQASIEPFAFEWSRQRRWALLTCYGPRLGLPIQPSLQVPHLEVLPALGAAEFSSVQFRGIESVDLVLASVPRQ